MPTEENYHIAVLIDAENVDPSYAEHIFAYAHSLGLVRIREIYGSGISLNEWADPILTNSIHTNFTLRPNRFKNSSDICLVIGAMEILAASRNTDKDRIDALIIASSDSDFSPLAVHLRSAGIDVIGMGEPGHINPMWPRACTDFIALEAKAPLTRKRDAEPAAAPAPAPVPAASSVPAPVITPAANAEPVNPAPAAQPVQCKAKEEPSNPVAEETKPAPQPAEDKHGKSAEGDKQKKESKKEQKKKETKAPAFAPSHQARVQVIRGFIAEKIAEKGGRIRSGELFRALAALPDYKYDQQRSRRNPLDYLSKQYSAWLAFEAGENGSSWISLRADADTSAVEPGVETAESAETVETVEPSEAAEATEPEESTEPAEHTEVSEPEQVPMETQGEELTTTAASEKTTKSRGGRPGRRGRQPKKAAPKEQPTKDAKAKPGGEPPQTAEAIPSEPQPKAANTNPNEQRLISAGIPAEHISQVAELLSQCRNLRDSYNRLRQAFGTETGKQYQESIKKAHIPFA